MASAMRLRVHVILLVIITGLAGRAVPAQEAQTGTSQTDEAGRIPRRIRVGGQNMQRMLVYKVNPQYPEEAKKAHIKGNVRLRILIGEDGRVKDVQPIEGNPLLSKAAMEAVRQFRYKPTKLNGTPVQVETEVDCKFH